MNFPLYFLIKTIIKNTEIMNGIIKIKNKKINLIFSCQINAEIPEIIAPTEPKSSDIPDALPSFFSSSFFTLFR